MSEKRKSKGEKRKSENENEDGPVLKKQKQKQKQIYKEEANHMNVSQNNVEQNFLPLKDREDRGQFNLERILACLTNVKFMACNKDQDEEDEYAKKDAVFITGNLATNPKVICYLKIVSFSIKENDFLLDMLRICSLRTPNKLERIGIYEFRPTTDLFLNEPALKAIPNYQEYFSCKNIEKIRTWTTTMCIMTCSVELSARNFIDYAREHSTNLFGDFVAVLYQLTYFILWLEHEQLSQVKIKRYKIEIHKVPIDIYYEHDKEKQTCVRVRTRFVVKFGDFYGSKIVEKTNVNMYMLKKSNKYDVDNIFKPFFDLLTGTERDILYSKLYNENNKIYDKLNKDKSKILKLLASAQSAQSGVGVFVVDVAVAEQKGVYASFIQEDEAAADSNETFMEILTRVLREEEATEKGTGGPSVKKGYIKAAVNTKIQELENIFDYRDEFFFTDVMSSNNHRTQDVNPFRVSPISPPEKNRVLARIGDLLMENTFKSILQSIILCYKHYVKNTQVFFLLLAGGLLGLYQNEILHTCGIKKTLKQWSNKGDQVTDTVKSFKNQYQWVLFDMVQRTIHIVENLKSIYHMRLPYNPDNSNIFQMCYTSKFRVTEANCILASMLEACYFQEVEKLMPNKIFIGLEKEIKATSAAEFASRLRLRPRAQNSKKYLQYKSTTSLRNDNFAPDMLFPTEGRYTTHWSSAAENKNGKIRKYRTFVKNVDAADAEVNVEDEDAVFFSCGPRNLNIGEHSEYIAKSVLYQQIHTMTKRLKNVNTYRFRFEHEQEKAYAATHLHAILFLLLRYELEAEAEEPSVLLQDYIENAKRDAMLFNISLPSKETLRQLFKMFFTRTLAKMIDDVDI